MQYYIDCLLTSEQRAALHEADLTFGEVTIGTEEEHLQGVVVSEEDVDQALGLLGLLRNPYVRWDYVYSPVGKLVYGLRSVKVYSPPTSENPVVCMSGCSSVEAVSLVLREAHGELRMGMMVDCGDGYGTDDQIVAGILLVKVYSLPTRVPGHDQSFRSRRGHYLEINDRRNLGRRYIAIRNDENETLAVFRGDASGGCLWLTGHSSREEDVHELVGYTLHVLARRLHSDLGEPLSCASYLAATSRARYVALAQRRMQQEMDSIGERINDANRGVEQARRNLVSALVVAEAARRRQQELDGVDVDAMATEFTERLNEEFTRLESSPDFESIVFAGAVVRATTRPITIEFENRRYKFGRYLIEMGPESLRITSVDGVKDRETRREFCHPHIYTDGDACLGSLTESAAKLQASMSYAILLPLLVRYLEAYNAGDSYRRVNEFTAPRQRRGEITNGSEADHRRRARRRRAAA